MALPEDALRLSPTQAQHILGKLNLHPGQFPVWEKFALSLHHLLQRTAKQGGSDDSPPAVVDLLQSGLPQALEGWEVKVYHLGMPDSASAAALIWLGAVYVSRRRLESL